MRCACAREGFLEGVESFIHLCILFHYFRLNFTFVSGSGWYHLDLVGELGNICELAYPRTNQIN